MQIACARISLSLLSCILAVIRYPLFPSSERRTRSIFNHHVQYLDCEPFVNARLLTPGMFRENFFLPATHSAVDEESSREIFLYSQVQPVYGCASIRQ